MGFMVVLEIVSPIEIENLIFLGVFLEEYWILYFSFFFFKEAKYEMFITGVNVTFLRRL